MECIELEVEMLGSLSMNMLKKENMMKQTSLDWVLSYNGHDNIVSVFLEDEECGVIRLVF